jgi:RNA recognition motif-containing protein
VNASHEKPRELASKTDLGATSSRKNCNLYVLNLSLDMTNESLKAIIQGSGEVKHVCVLATLDNAGRCVKISPAHPKSTHHAEWLKHKTDALQSLFQKKGIC